LWIAEVDLDIRSQGEALVVGGQFPKTCLSEKGLFYTQVPLTSGSRLRWSLEDGGQCVVGLEHLTNPTR
jgi:hypothetical protein